MLRSTFHARAIPALRSAPAPARSLTTLPTRAQLISTRLGDPSCSYAPRRYRSTEPPSPLHSVPSAAENVGSPAVDTKRGKFYEDVDEAVRAIKSGSVVLSAGFGLCGTAETIIQAIKRNPEIKDLTGVSNNAGDGIAGLAPLTKTGQIKKMLLSYVGTNKNLQDKYLNGEIEVELSPQGTIAERLRAAGAGMPGFYTRTGAGTFVETGEIPIKLSKKDANGKTTVITPGNKKDSAVFDGKKYLFEPAIHGDVAILRAWKVDKAGNCVFRYTTRAFGGLCARAAKLTIVEAENLVEIGDISPMDIDLPGIYVDRIVKATEPKKIELLTIREDPSAVSDAPASKDATQKSEAELAADSAKKDAHARRVKIAKRAAKEMKDGDYCNLGVGMPVLAANYLPKGTNVWLQSENGILGMGPYPTKDQVDADIINAGKETVTLVPGAATFDSSESFGMIRGGHIDVSMLGAMEVSAAGDLANFMIPGKLVKGMGGAMDLVSNPDETKIVVVTDHVDKYGKPKILEKCSLPLTGVKVVSKIITDLCVFEVDRVNGGLTVVELSKGTSIEEVQDQTGCKVEISKDLKRDAY